MPTHRSGLCSRPGRIHADFSTLPASGVLPQVVLAHTSHASVFKETVTGALQCEAAQDGLCDPLPRQ